MLAPGFTAALALTWWGTALTACVGDVELGRLSRRGARLGPGPVPAVACGKVTAAGCCDGATVWYCSGGSIQFIDCTPNPQCGWDGTSAWYDCGTSGGSDPSGKNPKACAGFFGDAGPPILDGATSDAKTDAVKDSTTPDASTSCGAVTYEGCCDGGTLWYCGSGVLKQLHCGASPKCGWDAKNGFYFCGTAGGVDPSGKHPKGCAAFFDGGAPPSDLGGVDQSGPDSAPVDLLLTDAVTDASTTDALPCGDGTCGASEDCQTCPKDCGTCDGCSSKPSAKCTGCKCEACVCASDAYCCTHAWDLLCATACKNKCGGCSKPDGGADADADGAAADAASSEAGPGDATGGLDPGAGEQGAGDQAGGERTTNDLAYDTGAGDTGAGDRTGDNGGAGDGCGCGLAADHRAAWPLLLALLLGVWTRAREQA